jgi:hypothetical protein
MLDAVLYVCSRLSEQYTLKAQLFCHQESLLPGQAVPLLLQLALQMHGQPAPLQLLQEVTLRLTATTQEGADVTQVRAPDTAVQYYKNVNCGCVLEWCLWRVLLPACQPPPEACTKYDIHKQSTNLWQLSR